MKENKFIDPNSKIGKSTVVEPFTYIDKNKWDRE